MIYVIEYFAKSFKITQCHLIVSVWSWILRQHVGRCYTFG